MKKLLALFLAALMLLACGCAPAAAPTDENDLLSMDDLTKTAATGSEFRLNLSDYAYIREGSAANTNWRDLNAKIGKDVNGGEPLLFRNDGTADGDLTRHILLSFDISSLKNSGFQKAFLVPSWGKLQSTEHRMNIYDLGSATWDGSTVTWSSAPQPDGEPMLENEVCTNFMPSHDITAAVQEALAEGRTAISLMLESVDYTKDYDELEPKTTVLVATTSDGVAAHTYQLVEDEKANKAIWDYVEGIFDEWYVRYQQLLNTPTATVEHIVSDRDEFTKTTVATSYMVTTGVALPASRFDDPSKSKTYLTRTYDALDDLGDYSDYDKEYPYDIYGGLMDPAMKQEATGFFYSKKLNGRWWFIDPLGYPCYIRALHQPTMNYRNYSEKQKQAAMTMYGSEEKWRISVCRWLQEDLYFNTLNSSNVFSDVEGQMVYQTGLSSLLYNYGLQIGVDDYKGGSTTFSENNTMPVFDPGFEKFCMEKAAVNAPKYKDDPWFLGYTTDNELPLQAEMLYNCMTLDINKQVNGAYVNHYSYAAAWTFLQKMTGKQNPSAHDVTEEILDLFRGFVYDRYLDVANTAIKTYDPNHMYLGCRFVTNSSKSIADAEWVARFASLHLDGATINWYGQWTIGDNQATSDVIEDDGLYKLCCNMDLPMILSEFYTKGYENDGSFGHPDTPLGNTRGAGWAVKTQQDRADFYQNFTLRLLECKNFVGWYWFMYIDNDDSPEAIYKEDGVTWRDQSSVDVNKGIVNNWHQPYEEICEAMAEINKNVYRLAEHFDAKYAK